MTGTAQLLEVTPRTARGDLVNDDLHIDGVAQVFAVYPPIDDAWYVVAFVVGESAYGRRELIVWRADRAGHTLRNADGLALVARHRDARDVADGLAALGYQVVA